MAYTRYAFSGEKLPLSNGRMIVRDTRTSSG